MYLLIEDLTRDRIRRIQRDAEISRAVTTRRAAKRSARRTAEK